MVVKRFTTLKRKNWQSKTSLSKQYKLKRPAGIWKIPAGHFLPCQLHWTYEVCSFPGAIHLHKVVVIMLEVVAQPLAKAYCSCCCWPEDMEPENLIS